MRSHDHHIIICCAIRYAVGRRTYIPHTISEYIKEEWPVLSTQHRSFLIIQLTREMNEKEQMFGEDSLGDECDQQTWNELISWMRKNEKN